MADHSGSSVVQTRAQRLVVAILAASAASVLVLAINWFAGTALGRADDAEIFFKDQHNLPVHKDSSYLPSLVTAYAVCLALFFVCAGFVVFINPRDHLG